MPLDFVRKLPYDHPYRWDGRKFGRSKLWTPDEITTELWLDAYDEDTITESGGDVSQWDDKSGNARHVTQATGSLQPQTGAFTLNGYNVISSPASSPAEYLAGSFGATLSQPNSIFVVGKYDTTSDALFDGIGASNRAAHYESGGNFRMYAGSALVADTSDTNPHIFGTVWNGASSSHRLDGGTPSTGNPGTHSLTGITLFAAYDGSFGLDGYIGEVIILNESVSTAVRQKIEGYLAWKWGLEANLPGGHPYEDYAPTV